MPRTALKGLGDAIRANTETKTLDELRQEGRRTFRVVNGQKVMRIIEAIVDDVVAREAGEIAGQDRERIVDETRRKFDRVLKMQNEQERRITELREQLRAADSDAERLRADKTFLESQVDAAKQTAGDSDANRRLARDLGRIKESIDSLERRTADVDQTVMDRVLEHLAEREARQVLGLRDELGQLQKRIETVGRDAAATRTEDIDAVVARLVGMRAEEHRDLTHRLERSLESLRTRLDGLSEELPQRDALSELDARLDALEHRAARVPDDAFAELGERLDAREDAQHKRIVGGVLRQLEAVAESVRGLQETSLAQREEILGDLDRRLEERDHAHAQSWADGLRHEVDTLREALSDARTDADATASAFADSQAQRDLQLTAAFRQELTAVRERTDSLRDLQTRTAEAQTAAIGALEQRIAGRGGLIGRTAVANLQTEIERLHENAEVLEQRTASALAAVTERLEALAESTARHAEEQGTVLTALRDEMTAAAQATAEAGQTRFESALDQALDKITRTMESATARPIEITAEATDVLLDKIFDASDAEMSSNLADLDVEERKTSTGIRRHLGRLLEMRGAVSANAVSANAVSTNGVD